MRPKYKIYGESTWKDVPCEKVETIPNDVDGLKHYVVKDKSRSSLLAKCRDGRKWKRDSCTKWSGYDSVRYLNSEGSFYCPNVDFYYFHYMIKRIASTLIRKVYIKYVEQSASQNLAVVRSMLHFRATGLIYFMLEFIHAQQKS